MADLTVPSRFCGPANSGNGGYVCGRVAAYLDGPVLDGPVLDGPVLDGPATVTLHRPPPLATAMTVETDAGGTVRVRHGNTLPAVGDECRVIAWMTGRDGRKLTAGSALLGSDGQVLAVARTVWLIVPRPHPAMAGKEAS